MAHVTQVSRVMVPVADQDAAIEFYTRALSFELVADVPFGDGDRWVEVAPPGGGTALALVPPRGDYQTGRMTGIALATTDADAAHDALKAEGCRRRRGDDGRRRHSAEAVLLPRSRREHADDRRVGFYRQAGAVARSRLDREDQYRNIIEGMSPAMPTISRIEPTRWICTPDLGIRQSAPLDGGGGNGNRRAGPPVRATLPFGSVITTPSPR